MTIDKLLDMIRDVQRNIAPLAEREGHVATCPAVGTNKACSQRCLQVRLSLVNLDVIERELATMVPAAPHQPIGDSPAADDERDTATSIVNEKPEPVNETPETVNDDPEVEAAREVLAEISEPLTPAEALAADDDDMRAVDALFPNKDQPADPDRTTRTSAQRGRATA